MLNKEFRWLVKSSPFLIFEIELATDPTIRASHPERILVPTAKFGNHGAVINEERVGSSSTLC